MLINFDFDGVIADTFEQLIAHGIQAQKMIGLGRPPLAEDFRNVENLTWEGVGLQIGVPSQAIGKFEDIAFGLQEQSDETPKFYDGMIDVIKKVSVENVLAVVSSSSSEILHKRLTENGVEGLFSRITGGEVGMTKSESILKNMSQFSSQADQTYMIGDAVSDIRYGKEAKVKTVGVTWGFQSRELLKAEGPDMLIHRPEELLDLFMNPKIL